MFLKYELEQIRKGKEFLTREGMDALCDQASLAIGLEEENRELKSILKRAKLWANYEMPNAVAPSWMYEFNRILDGDGDE